MLLSPEEISSSTGILDSLSRGCELLGIPTVFIQLLAAGISLSIIGALVLYIASPIKMLFGSVEKGLFPEKLTEANEQCIGNNDGIDFFVPICTSVSRLHQNQKETENC